MTQYPLTTDFDFVGELSDALEFCEGLVVKASVMEGPAGGNPNVIIEFRNRFELYGFVHKLYNGQKLYIDEALETRGIE